MPPMKFGNKLLAVTLALAVAVSIGLAFLSLSSTEVFAKKYQRQNNYDRIRIESRFSPNKYIIAPVRRASDGGTEVRLPSGSWIHCQRNCRWTVQKEYLDFFAYQQNPFGPGYLRFQR